MTTINPVSSGIQTPQFKKQPQIVSVEQYPDYKVVTMKTEASTGKKWGVGVASAICPGLGQAVNGEWGKAVAFFAAGMILPGIIGAAAGGVAGLKSKAASIIAAKLSMFASITVSRVWSIVDAVKNTGTETVQMIPNNIDTKA